MNAPSKQHTAKHGLELRGLCKRYGAHAAIDDVSLIVAPGEFVCLLGPSGSGKTSILMTIAGFVAADAGEIWVDGARINELPPEKRNFGVVFQGYALFPHMTVCDNVAYPLSVRGLRGAESKKRVTRMLDLMQIAALADRLPRQLSGGQQQRVALARALIFEPPIVLLDEPLSALDKKLRTDLQLELKALHARLGTTFVMVTHDQEEAMTLSDRVAILREGRIVQVGSPAELYDRPVNKFVAEFLGRATFLEGIIESYMGDAMMLNVLGTCVKVSPRKAGLEIGARLVLALRPERVAITNGSTTQTDCNWVEGKITSAAFMGMQLLYVVETSIGSITALVPSFGQNALKPVGSTISVEWPADAAIPISDTPISMANWP